MQQHYASSMLPLSVVSDQTTTSATSSQTYKFLHKHKEINGVMKQITLDTWTTNNNVQYFYGWLGVRSVNLQ
ncbi:unnamed protein product [Dracunculus medinensis]|uniref:Ovule protein n=1 Tax=Dracunculus medinensis TaxID=318479 RepID=A0A0N4UMR7_DRAME|nr:unnamed protein product [Dracunculus medinensis]